LNGYSFVEERFCRLIVGGTSLVLRVRAATAADKPPQDANRFPVAPFVDETARPFLLEPNSLTSARFSAASSEGHLISQIVHVIVSRLAYD
jgi:hypothetical protein